MSKRRGGLRAPRLFRAILPVTDIEQATAFYSRLLDIPGERVWVNRHYFDCGGTILACVDPQHGEGSRGFTHNPEHIYFAVADLEAVYEQAKQAGCQWLEGGIREREWGERSFYAEDPFGNPICFVDEATVYTGTRRA